MSLKDDLEKDVKKIFASRWTERDGQVVPNPEDLQLGNDAVKLEGTVLYADMDGSTNLVDEHSAQFAAEVYKAYLHCAAKVIRSEGGEITAYDGDRVMAVFIGDSKNTTAVKAGLKINYCVLHVVNPLIKAQYPKTTFTLRHTVGIDTSKLLVARTGIRGANDLVWVGRSANYAAKLTTLSADYPTWITDAVYNKLSESARLSNGREMWERRLWTSMGNMAIYRSNWHWRVRVDAQ